MRAKLNDDQIIVFKELDSSGYTLTQLSNRFSISISTAERYRNPKYRELGREIQRRKNKREKTCYKCGGALSTHSRCAGCDILIHGEVCCLVIPNPIEELALTNIELQ